MSYLRWNGRIEASGGVPQRRAVIGIEVKRGGFLGRPVPLREAAIGDTVVFECEDMFEWNDETATYRVIVDHADDQLLISSIEKNGPDVFSGRLTNFVRRSAA